MATLLPRLVDLSIGTPEVGAVNFVALHKLLSLIVKKLDFPDKDAGIAEVFPFSDYRAGKSDVIKPASVHAANKSIRDAYSIDNSAKISKSIAGETVSFHPTKSKSRKPTAGETSTKPAETSKSLGSGIRITPFNPSKMSKSVGSGAEIESGDLASYRMLENKVNSLEKDLNSFYTKLSSLHEMTNLVKSDNPFVDLWQFFSIAKKVEASEEGLKVVMDLVQQLFNGQRQINARCGEMQELIENSEILLADSSRKFSSMQSHIDELLVKVDHLGTVNEEVRTVKGTLGIASEFEYPATFADVASHKELPIIHQVSSKKIEHTIADANISDPSTRVGSPLHTLKDIIETVETLKSTIDSYPRVKDVVTWPSFEDALKGIHRGFAKSQTSKKFNENGSTPVKSESAAKSRSEKEELNAENRGQNILEPHAYQPNSTVKEHRLKTLANKLSKTKISQKTVSDSEQSEKEDLTEIASKIKLVKPNEPENRVISQKASKENVKSKDIFERKASQNMNSTPEQSEREEELKLVMTENTENRDIFKILPHGDAMTLGSDVPKPTASQDAVPSLEQLEKEVLIQKTMPESRLIAPKELAKQIMQNYSKEKIIIGKGPEEKDFSPQTFQFDTKTPLTHEEKITTPPHKFGSDPVATEINERASGQELPVLKQLEDDALEHNRLPSKISPDKGTEGVMKTGKMYKAKTLSSKESGNRNHKQEMSGNKTTSSKDPEDQSLLPKTSINNFMTSRDIDNSPTFRETRYKAAQKTSVTGVSASRDPEDTMVSLKDSDARVMLTSASEMIGSGQSLGGPSDAVLVALASLGGVDTRLQNLADQVEQMNDLIGVDSGRLQSEPSEELVQKLDGVSNHLEEMESMKVKLHDMEVLLSDLPETEDEQFPKIGDKSRLNNISSLTSMGNLTQGASTVDITSPSSLQNVAHSDLKSFTQPTFSAPQIYQITGRPKAESTKLREAYTSKKNSSLGLKISHQSHSKLSPNQTSKPDLAKKLASYLQTKKTNQLLSKHQRMVANPIDEELIPPPSLTVVPESRIDSVETEETDYVIHHVSEGTNVDSNMTTMNARDDSLVRSSTDVFGRFKHTLREVVHKDYMPEIRRLEGRLEKLEDRSIYSVDDSESRGQFLGSAEDEKLNKVFYRMDSLRDDINKRIRNMDEDLNALLEQAVGDSDSMQKTVVALGDFQSQLRVIRDITIQMQLENDRKATLINALKQECKRLDAEKVSKNSLEFELDNKADRSEMNDKTDKSQFDTVTQELHEIIDDLVNKLLALEEAWQNAHIKLELDVDKRAARETIENLKRTIERKMRSLGQKIKEQQRLLYSTVDEAAGMRRQLPFHCLSCDKAVIGIQYGLGDHQYCSGHKIGALCSQNSISETDMIRQHLRSNTPVDDCSKDMPSTAKRNDLKAYMVHFGKQQNAKVFITKSKARLLTNDGEDIYNKQRACGGKHTVTQNKLQGQIIQPGKNQSLKDILGNEEFVAVGVLKQEEQVITGADGRSYKSRTDTIQVDNELTKAIQITRDPIMPIVDELKQSRNSRHPKTSKPKDLPMLNAQSKEMPTSNAQSKNLPTLNAQSKDLAAFSSGAKSSQSLKQGSQPSTVTSDSSLRRSGYNTPDAEQ